MANWMQVTIDDGELLKAVKKHMDSLLAEFGGYDGLREMADQRRRLYDVLKAAPDARQWSYSLIPAYWGWYHGPRQAALKEEW